MEDGTLQASAATGQQTIPSDGMERQLSLDTAKDRHSYRSWNRVSNQHLGLGPFVNAQTIPARGTNAGGASAHQLHISVRCHYKEKGTLFV